MLRVLWIVFFIPNLLFAKETSSAKEAPKSVAPATPQAEIECLGTPSTSGTNLVFLHGMGSARNLGPQNPERAVLKKIANEVPIGIAMPRSERPCKPGKLNEDTTRCWSTANAEDDMKHNIPLIEESVKRCFPKTKRIGLLGFSNGGYFAFRLHRSCELKERLPMAAWVMTAGSARWNGSLGDNAKDLSACGKLLIFSGERDTGGSDKDGKLIQLLKAAKADAEEISYPGRHELPYAELKTALQKWIAP